MNGVRCQLVVPVSFEPGQGPLDRAQMAMSRLIGLEALQTERPSRADGHDLTPESRLQAQLDLVLDALREVQTQLRPLPEAHAVEVTPESIGVPDLAAIPAGPGWLALWLDGRMPQPVWLPVTSDGQGRFLLSPPDDVLAGAIDQLVFRLHRRAVARSRREHGVDSLSLPSANPETPAAP